MSYISIRKLNELLHNEKFDGSYKQTADKF